MKEISYKSYLWVFVGFIIMSPFMEVFGGKNLFSIASILAFIVLFIYSESKEKLILAGVAFYSIIYMLFTHNGDFLNRFQYMLSFMLTVGALFTIDKLKISEITKINKTAVFGCFLTFALLNLFFAKPSEGGLDGRIYYIGFIGAHEFSYLTAYLGYFLLKMKNKWGLLIVLMGFPVGARSGLVLNMIVLFYFFWVTFRNSKFGIMIYSVIGVACTALLFSMKSDILENISLITSTFENFTFDIFSEDNEMAFMLTASRNILWAIFFQKVISDGFCIDNLIGRGPYSSNLMNERIYGEALWMHNDFFDIFFCLGLLGLILYFFAIYRFFKNTGKDYFFLAMLVLSGFTNGFFGYKAIVIIALVAYYYQWNNKIEQDNQQDEEHEEKEDNSLLIQS